MIIIVGSQDLHIVCYLHYAIIILTISYFCFKLDHIYYNVGLKVLRKTIDFHIVFYIFNDNFPNFYFCI